MAREYYRGEYVVQNKEKYIGNKNPIYKSSWESRLCYFLDNSQKVIKWGYEILTIQYFSPIDKRVHRYYPDFYVELSDISGFLKKYVVEVKPSKESIPPKEPKNNNGKARKRYMMEAQTFIVNKCKWEAAEIFCKQQGFEFKIITEKDIFQ